jgi:uncharacterized protein YjbI with pentapeptide repeats
MTGRRFTMTLHLMIRVLALLCAAPVGALEGAGLGADGAPGTYGVASAPGERETFVGADLRGTDLRAAALEGADLQRANLSGANLTGLNLARANLARTRLRGANLAGANLESANMADADLRGANLTTANLTGVNLKGANLKGADVDRVLWSNTVCPDGTNSNSHGGTCEGHL